MLLLGWVVIVGGDYLSIVCPRISGTGKQASPVCTGFCWSFVCSPLRLLDEDSGLFK